MVRFSRLAILFLPILIFTTGCDLFQRGNGPDVTPPPPVTLAPTEVVPPITPETPDSSPQTAPISGLRLWIPAEIGTRTEAGTQEFASQIRAYETGQSNLTVSVEQKPVEGPGGVINYLQTGRTVAPSIMPDIVAVPTSLLADARYRDLFHPLNTLIDPTFMNDIYPAPAGQVVAEGDVLGYPFATNGLTHLIFNQSVITGTIPMNWTQLISDTNHTLVIPADSREGAMLALQFYLAEGGALFDSAGKMILEPEPLARALESIGARRENLLQSHQLKTLDEAWQYHQIGLSDFMWTRSEFLLSRQALDPSLLDTLDYSAVPGVSGALIPLTTSWAWTITTPDPVRQALAADLIMFLTAPENLATWSSRSQILPAQKAAMELLAEQNPYLVFSNQELERARPMPVSETSRLMDVLGDAVFQVLTTENQPSLIAEESAIALRQ